MTSREFVRKWVEKAEENLRAAEVLAERGMYAAACFHVQQAAEMALKGLLINLAGIQPLTHSLVEIAEKVMEYSTARLPDVNELRWLQEHYLQIRYPNARLSKYVAEEAERAVRIAAEVVKAVNEEIRR